MFEDIWINRNVIIAVSNKTLFTDRTFVRAKKKTQYERTHRKAKERKKKMNSTRTRQKSPISHDVEKRKCGEWKNHYLNPPTSVKKICMRQKTKKWNDFIICINAISSRLYIKLYIALENYGEKLQCNEHNIRRYRSLDSLAFIPFALGNICYAIGRIHT